jgi:hypothetical protein
MLLRGHVGPPSKRIMTTGGRHNPSESFDPDVRPTQGADDGGTRDIRWQRFRIWMRRRCVGRALSTPRPCRPADPNAWRPTKNRAPVRAAKIAKALDLAVSPRPAADCPGLGGLGRTRARPSGTSCPLTCGQGNSPFSFAAMDSS